MEEEQYIQAVSEILDSIEPILEDVRRCVVGDGRRHLDQADKRRKAALRSCLPLAEELFVKKEKSMLELKFLTVLPSIQKIGIEIGVLLRASTTKIGSSIPFTDKAINEINEVILGAEDLARKTKDVFLKKNPHLDQQVQSDESRLYKMADDHEVDHVNRLTEGLCSPLASYLYLEIMEALKGAVYHLALLSQKA
jgi:Na+/phosphate symporter